jgi:hypothetical protein
MKTPYQQRLPARYLKSVCFAALLVPALTGAAQSVTYTDRPTWEAAAGTPSTVIDFTTRDDGCPITFPVWDSALSPIHLRGAEFLGARTYWNLSLYVFPAQVLRVNLPAGTSAFGTDLSPFYNVAGSYTISLSTGEVFSLTPAFVPWTPDFFGVDSPVDIDWVDFSYDNTYMVLDNFAYLPGQQKLFIDVRPNNANNHVDLQSTGKLPVAVFGSPTFDPHQIDIAGLRLGATGQEAAPSGQVFKDVDSDGNVDLLVRFTIADIAMSCTTRQLMLKGTLLGGQVIVGTDQVHGVNCPP